MADCHVDDDRYKSFHTIVRMFNIKWPKSIEMDKELYVSLRVPHDEHKAFFL